MSEGGFSVKNMAVKFQTADYPGFHVEYTNQGADIIYHFWPPEEEERFEDLRFAQKLEQAFQKGLPPGISVEADYTDYTEASVRLMNGRGLVPQKDFDKPLVKARETYYVRVVGIADNPFADKFLKGKIFENLQNLLQGN